jgi:hypothetical protein
MSKIDYPVPKIAREIEADWADLIAAHFHVTVPDVLSASRPWFEFPQGVLAIELMDGSRVEFKFAFYLIDEAKRAIAVFTEHCGHHVFPYHESRVFRDRKLVWGIN